MRHVTWLWVVLLGVLGCSGDFTSKALGVKYEPPKGMGLRAEEPGVARFEGGLELRSVQGTPPPVEAAPDVVLGAAGLPLPGRVVQASKGTLPAGPVARYEFTHAGARTLVYFVPGKERFVLVTFTAPERDYGALSSKVELSLSTLKLLH